MSKNFGNKEDETLVKDVNRVSCDGGKLGHPKVFLTLVDTKVTICPYCSHKFLKKNHSMDTD